MHDGRNLQRGCLLAGHLGFRILLDYDNTHHYRRQHFLAFSDDCYTFYQLRLERERVVMQTTSKCWGEPFALF